MMEHRMIEIYASGGSFQAKMKPEVGIV